MPGIRTPIDPNRRLTAEQAAPVLERLAEMSAYLSRLGWRLRENGFEPGVRTCDLVDAASAAVGSLRRYLADEFDEPGREPPADWQI